MSFANLFASSLQTLANIHGKDDGTLHSTLSFFGGIVLILLIDKLIPHYTRNASGGRNELKGRTKD